MSMDTQKIADCAAMIRLLSAAMVDKAQSGHPGAPLGMAEMLATLYMRHLSFSPQQPLSPLRDRFVLSNGHASAALYSLLYLMGYAMDVEDLQAFRQCHSQTPGHPEWSHTAGVEVTTGPLGQGIAHAVGMAHALTTFHAQGQLAHCPKVFVTLGEGCLMEGISHEACAYAGSYQLNNLIVLYDCNHISIDGDSQLWMREDVLMRMQAYGWDTLDIDGHDIAALDAALSQARQATRPCFIQARTQIGRGAPSVVGKAKAHGAPLSAQDLQALYHAHAHLLQGMDVWQACVQWRTTMMKMPLTQTLPAPSAAFFEPLKLPFPSWPQPQPRMATRAWSGWVIEHCLQDFPQILGGSADLTPSNNTRASWHSTFSPDHRTGRYIHYGVREAAMAAIANGMALCGAVPYIATFLTFSDYLKPALRMSALMRLRTVYLLTHDSLALGEDGPTHQPIEHLAMLRAMPHVAVWRPCDPWETYEAWQQALMHEGPSCLILSRQAFEVQTTQPFLIEKGARWIEGAWGTPCDLWLLASGSDVALCQEVAKRCAEHLGWICHISSIPCLETALEHDEMYHHKAHMARYGAVVVESAVIAFWHKLLPSTTLWIGLSDYGLSGPGPEVMQERGMDAQSIERRIYAHTGVLTL